MKHRFKVTYNAPVTLTLVIACFLVLILGTITGGETTQFFFMTFHSGLDNPLTYVRFFTYVLGHSGWDHFIGNASMLLLLGPMLEEKYSSKTMLQLILVTAVVTALINYIFFWNVAICGASGIVFAFILLGSFTGFKNGEIPLTFVLVFILYMGQQVYDGIFVQDNVSNFAHIMGGFIGALWGYFFNRK